MSRMPKDRGDFIGLCVTIFLLTTISLYELSTLYRLYDDHQKQDPNAPSLTNLVISFVIGAYILIQVIVNMVYTVTTDTSIYAIRTYLPTTLISEWHYCPQCELNAPPRSYHCITCGKCILKRTNHCLFLGKCCGHLNARYYYLFLIYTWFGTIFCNYLNVEYLLDLMHNGFFNPRTLFATFMPMLAWVFGIVDNMRLLTVFINTTCLILSIILFLYLIVNLKMVLNGQTWYENANDNHEYNLGFYENFKSIFGTNWLHAFLNPFSSYRRVQGDDDRGIYFKRNLFINKSSNEKFI